ncbi:hypothetical protein HED60_14000 [Planctomycetales bacterium ZRK34]|nr:hypothetical protein HED60_14000 [Planctomycetales bacterium ZRK34]
MMAKRIRILEPKAKELSFQRRLEQRAREIVKRRADSIWDGSPLSVVEREMAMTLSQMDHLRHVRWRMRRQMFQLELRIDTRLIQLTPRSQLQPDYHQERRAKLRDKLEKLDQERRKLDLEHEKQLRPLQDRLIILFNRHRQLNP